MGNIIFLLHSLLYVKKKKYKIIIIINTSSGIFFFIIVFFQLERPWIWSDNYFKPTHVSETFYFYLIVTDTGIDSYVDKDTGKVASQNFY